MFLTTKRLLLIPLTDEQLSLYTKQDNSLETALQLNPGNRGISSRAIKTIEQKIRPILADASVNYLFYTIWIVVLKEEKIICGDIYFKGEAEENGEVEIGYATDADQQNKGIMTEAVSAISKWALTQKKVTSVIAETDPANLSSQKILEKNGFQKTFHTNDNVGWKLSVPE